MKHILILVMLVSVGSVQDIKLNRLNEVFRGHEITKVSGNVYSVDGCEVEIILDGQALNNDSYNEIINCLE